MFKRGSIHMKTVKISIAALMLCVWASFSAMAAQGVISFSDPQVTVGDEVNVSMKVTADEGTALESANIVLTYPSGLEFVSGTDSDGGAGAVRVHGTTNGGGTAELEYNLKFKTSEAGSFAIGIDSYEVYDANDQPIEFTHLGSSTVTVSAAEGASTDATLSSLEAYPGTLEPAFSADVTEYNLTVGLGVSDITVNAIGADPAASVSIQKSYEAELPEGASDVTVTVNAGDGTSSAQYVIHVNKVEGGPEATESAPANVEGIKLSSKGKTIIVMNPPADAEVPEGLKEGTITIDGQKVQGWVWGASEEPEYCVVYGMTADSSKSGDSTDSYGNIGFYRYDMTEKTIQRYFVDPLADGMVSSAEYAELQDQLNTAQRKAETRLIVMVALAVIAFAAVMLSVYMSIRYKSNEKVQRAYRRRSFERYNSSEDDSDMKIAGRSGSSGSDGAEGDALGSNVSAGNAADLNAGAAASAGLAGAAGFTAGDMSGNASGSMAGTVSGVFSGNAADAAGLGSGSIGAAGTDEANELLKHEFNAGSFGETEQSAADETQVIRRPERKRRPRRVIRAERIQDEDDIADIDAEDSVPGENSGDADNNSSL